MIQSFDGKTPKIAPSAWVSPLAHVIGDVEIGENSSIWPGAVIRGDTAPIRIGRNTNIQDNCVIHGDLGRPVTIGDNVTFGHHVVVHCAFVANNVLVGINATLLNDAEIGESCIIGANALITEGTKVPPGTLWVGVPAKQRGELRPDQRELILKRSQNYLDLVRRYREQGL